MNEWTTMQSIMHWVVTCITWGIVARVMVYVSKAKCQYAIFQKCQPIEAWKWCVVAIDFIAKVIYSYYDWQGFKVLLEFKSHGALEFLFQYMYYAVETMRLLFIELGRG